MPTRPNEVWSLPCPLRGRAIHDQLSGGAKFRALTVVDVFSREGLAIEVGQRLKAEHVVEVLNRLVGQRGAPRTLFADNVLYREALGHDGQQVSFVSVN